MRKINLVFRSLILISIFILIVKPTAAQVSQIELNFGLNSGFNSTRILDKGLKSDKRYRGIPTYKWAPIGASFGFNLANNFSMQFEALIAHEGQLFNFVDLEDKKIGEREISLSYFNLPVLIQFRSSGKKVRTVFSIGPEISLMRFGEETIFNESAIVTIPDGVTPPVGSVKNADGTYTIPSLGLTTIASLDGLNSEGLLKEVDFRILADVSLHIIASPKFYINVDVRSSYGFMDIRGDELLKNIEDNTAIFDDILSQRANFSVGVWVGLQYYFRFDPMDIFKKRKKKEKEIEAAALLY